MTIEKIKEKSGLSIEVAGSIYYHCIWLRKAKDNAKVDFSALLYNKKYRLTGEK